MSEDDFQGPRRDSEQRKTPYNELDLQFMVTEPAWGREATAELNRRVSHAIGSAYYQCRNCGARLNQGYACNNCPDGGLPAVVIDKEPLWGLLSYYTRDLRLGNLSNWGSEINYCHHWLSLAGDLLRAGHIKSFMSALSRVIDRLEISQSKNGFYRKRMGTVTQEVYSNRDIDPKRKNLVTNKVKENNNN